ncbi:hypothetical protein SRHO_G00128350 [Serrasalmus rhombeus]
MVGYKARHEHRARTRLGVAGVGNHDVMTDYSLKSLERTERVGTEIGMEIGATGSGHVSVAEGTQTTVGLLSEEQRV